MDLIRFGDDRVLLVSAYFRGPGIWAGSVTPRSLLEAAGAPQGGLAVALTSTTGSIWTGYRDVVELHHADGLGWSFGGVLASDGGLAEVRAGLAAGPDRLAFVTSAGPAIFALPNQPDLQTDLAGWTLRGAGLAEATAFAPTPDAVLRQSDPTVAVARDGGAMLVAWFDAATAGGTIVARLFDAAGAPLSAVAPVGEAGHGEIEGGAKAAALAGGGFVVVWRRGGTEGAQLLARRLDEAGAAAGPEVTLLATPAGHAPARHEVVALAGGGFAVAASEAGTAAGAAEETLRIGVFAADGTPLGAAVAPWPSGGAQGAPRLVALHDGGFALAWQDAALGGTALRIFDAAGTPVAGPVMLAGSGGVLAGLADGRLAWLYDVDITPQPANYPDTHALHAQEIDARLSGVMLLGTADPDRYVGSPFGDVMVTGAGDDIVAPGGGNDALDGGPGSDAAVWAGARSHVQVHSFAAGGRILTRVTDLAGAEGTDLLVGVETLGFQGGAAAFGLAGIQQNLRANFAGGRFDGVLLRDAATGGLGHMMGDGAGLAGFSLTLAGLPAGWDAFAGGDVTGDGRAEMLLEDGAGGIFAVDLAGGSPAWRAVGGVAPGMVAVAAADVNGDGTLDILLRDAATHVVTALAYAPDGGAAWYLPVGDYGAGWRIVGLGDVNRDGAAELVIQQEGSGLTWYRDIAHGAWGVASDWVGAAWRAVAVADLNGDGFADIVFRNAATGDVWYRDMLGGAGSGWGVLAGGALGWTPGRPADLDNDGDLDVPLQRDADGMLAWADIDGWGPAAWHGAAAPAGWVLA